MGDTEWRREEPMSPAARLMDDIDIYVITTFGLDTPINLPVFLLGMDSALAQHPRYGCIQVSDKGLWARTTTVNVEDHIIIPTLDPSAVATDSEKVVEDYVASLSALPMHRSRPLWDFHLLNFPTSEAASTVVFRVHHSIGDGMSLMASLMTTTRLVAAAATATSPATPTPARRPPTRRTGAIYEMPRPQLSAGALAFAAWVWSYFVLAWNTAVDLAFVLATIMFLSDPHTMFKRVKNKDESFHSKRFVHRSLSLDDVKFIKNVMNCSVNDVLVGVTSAAMSQYYFRNKSGDPNSTGEICLRSIIPVSMRPATTLQKYVNVIESDKKDDVIWGNQLGYIILPFHLTKHDDPLAYVRKAKKDLDRKKRSLEVIITNKIAEILMIFFGVKAGALIFRRGFAHTSMVFSNMVGPTEQVELFGHPVAFVAPSVYGIPEALIVHYQSYRRTIKVILSMDDNKFPDYRQLLDDFAKSLMTMKQAASRLSTSTKTD